MTVKQFNREVVKLSEDTEQMMLIKWSQQENVRKKYPELALLYHIPNERKCSIQQGKRFKAMGVKSGVPDLCLPVPRGKYHSLYIEMKAKNGRMSDNQKWWNEQLNGQDNYCVTCYGWEEASQVIERYLCELRK